MEPEVQARLTTLHRPKSSMQELPTKGQNAWRLRWRDAVHACASRSGIPLLYCDLGVYELRPSFSEILQAPWAEGVDQAYGNVEIGMQLTFPDFHEIHRSFDHPVEDEVQFLYAWAHHAWHGPQALHET